MLTGMRPPVVQQETTGTQLSSAVPIQISELLVSPGAAVLTAPDAEYFYVKRVTVSPSGGAANVTLTITTAAGTYTLVNAYAVGAGVLPVTLIEDMLLPPGAVLTAFASAGSQLTLTVWGFKYTGGALP